MLDDFRSYLRKRLPPSNRAFKRGVADIMTAVRQGQDVSSDELLRLCAANGSSLELLAALEAGQQRNHEMLSELTHSVRDLANQQAVSAQGLGGAGQRLEALERSAEAVSGAINETLWAQIFRDTVASSDWLIDKTFSPGRWAVGYPYLYVLYRVLNEVRPQRILELGLGQSTRMMAQFAAGHEDVQHLVVEHDDAWISFFASNYRLPERTEVVKLDWDYVAYKDTEGVRVYSGFAQALEGMQFNLISIDGPLGGDMEHFARIDVLGLLPHCLAPSFVILLDDLERAAEARTMREMQHALSEAGIDHLACHYSGSKDLGLLCSTDLAFLCSL